MNRKQNNSSYPVLSLSITPSIKMEREDLERFCHENNLPLFQLQVVKTVEMGVVQSCKPYTKYFTFYEGQQFTATESVEVEEVKTTIQEVPK